MKQLHIIPDGWPISLKDCPPGLFVFNGTLGVKDEYRNPPICADTGEAFWGGAKTAAERDMLTVQPVRSMWVKVEA